MSSVTLFISMLCLSLHCTGVERIHICTYPCHAHAYSFALRLSSCLSFTRVGPLVSCKSCMFPFHLDVSARLLTDLETRRFGILSFHTNNLASSSQELRPDTTGHTKSPESEMVRESKNSLIPLPRFQMWRLRWVYPYSKLVDGNSATQ